MPTGISMSLAVKLGSIMVHAEEILDHAHPLDVEATRALLADPEVAAWRAEMDKAALLPKKRQARDERELG